MTKAILAIALIFGGRLALADDTRIAFRTGGGFETVQGVRPSPGSAPETFVGQIFTQEVEYERINGNLGRSASFTYGSRPWTSGPPRSSGAFAEYALTTGARFYFDKQAAVSIGQLNPFIGVRVGASYLDTGATLAAPESKQYGLQAAMEDGFAVKATKNLGFSFTIGGLFNYSLAETHLNTIEFRGMGGVYYGF